MFQTGLKQVIKSIGSFHILAAELLALCRVDSGLVVTQFSLYPARRALLSPFTDEKPEALRG